LIEQASDVIFITDASGTIQVVNTSATLLTGYPETALLQMKLQDILWNDDQSPITLDENNVSGQVLISEKLLINQHRTFIPVEC
ncbi:PAS domain-containing protein, partial [Salmonella enterica]|uniref:PAS domain-containing protein n=1 Tax=Salmonella enterica TaxID=28901 RepID=UPI003CF55FA8